MIKTKKDGSIIIGSTNLLYRLFNLGYTFKFDNKRNLICVYNEDENKIAKINLKDITEVSYTLKYGNMAVSYKQGDNSVRKDVLFSIKSLKQNEIDFLINFFVSSGKKTVNADDRQKQSGKYR